MKLYKYFLREKCRKRLLVSLDNPFKRVSSILGVGKRTLERWISDIDAFEASVPPLNKSGPRKKLDDFDKDVINREIVKMFGENKDVTMKGLKHRLQQRNDIAVSKVTLWRAVRSLGFKFKKVDANSDRATLCERAHLVAARCKYLRAVREKRESGYDIVYLDETWINTNHTKPYQWVSSNSSQNRRIPEGKGQRLIVLHAGSKEVGFIPDCQLVFKSISTDNRDYHCEMNSEIFQEWLLNRLLPALDRPSCIVMDNASYHNIKSDSSKVPTSSSRKSEITAWLSEHGIVFDPAALKPELLNIVKANKPKTVFKVDELIEEHGHTSLRLPPYHAMLNPIELVWAKVKSDVAKNNTTFKLSDLKELANTALSQIDQTFWQKVDEHVQKVENQYWERDGVGFLQREIIINVIDDTADSE